MPSEYFWWSCLAILDLDPTWDNNMWSRPSSFWGPSDPMLLKQVGLMSSIPSGFVEMLAWISPPPLSPSLPNSVASKMALTMWLWKSCLFWKRRTLIPSWHLLACTMLDRQSHAWVNVQDFWHESWSVYDTRTYGIFVSPYIQHFACM